MHVRTLTHPKDAGSWTGCAYAYLAGRKVSVWQAKAVSGGRWAEKPADPGEIVALTGEGLLVKAGRGMLLIADADLEGARERGLPGLIEFLAAGLPAILG